MVGMVRTVVILGTRMVIFLMMRMVMMTSMI